MRIETYKQNFRRALKEAEELYTAGPPYDNIIPQKCTLSRLTSMYKQIENWHTKELTAIIERNESYPTPDDTDYLNGMVFILKCMFVLDDKYKKCYNQYRKEGS